MALSLERKTEAWIQAVIAEVEALAEIQVVQGDDTSEARAERIIVTADAGEKQEEGPRAYPVEVTIELRSTNRNSGECDDIFARIEDAMASPGALATAGGYFDLLILLDAEETAEKSRSGQTRYRSRTFPFLIREK